MIPYLTVMLFLLFSLIFPLSGAMAKAAKSLESPGLRQQVPVVAWSLPNKNTQSTPIAKALVMRYGMVWEMVKTRGTNGTTSLLTPVPGLNNVTEILVNHYYQNESYIAREANGTVWTWGNNRYGQLGDGTTVDRTTPVQVLGLSHVTTIEAGHGRNYAVQSDGSLWAWGVNGRGQLGDGSAVNPLSPVRVLDLNNVIGVAIGAGANYVLQADGTVWGWSDGQDLRGWKTTPTTLGQVAGLTDIQTIVTTGFGARYALKRDGTVWTWGTTTAQVPGLSDITALATTETSAYALKGDGTVWAWGANQYGQLGDGTMIDRPNPVPVLGLTRVESIATGFYCAFALQENGKVWGWGYNGNGLLGDGSETDRDVPVLISQLDTPKH